MASILSLLSILALFFAAKRRTPILLRAIWIGFVVFFFQAILATSSRGGFAALGGGLFGWALARFGKKGLILVPIMMGAVGLIGGRQGDLSLNSGTGQSRIQIQHVGLTVYVSRPLFGVGTGHYVIDIAHHVAHNSFLQAFAETGFIGGAIFCAAYGFSVLTLIQLGRPGTIEYIDPDLSEFRPCVVGLLSCECVAKMSLTHNWLLTTYLFWALTTVYLKLCGDRLGRDRWTQKPLLVWYFGFGILGTMFFYFYLNAMVRFG
jgi:O-antigen ligase